MCYLLPTGDRHSTDAVLLFSNISLIISNMFPLTIAQERGICPLFRLFKACLAPPCSAINPTSSRFVSLPRKRLLGLKHFFPIFSPLSIPHPLTPKTVKSHLLSFSSNRTYQIIIKIDSSNIYIYYNSIYKYNK
jgi:hypothetical protein